MVALFGNAEGGLQPTNKRPRVILLLGLQGAGKTTTAGKLGKWLAKQGRHPLLVSTDVKRPAAIQQLNVVGQKAALRVHDPAGEMDPVARAKGAVAEAATLGFDAVIVDTAGRLHIDDELMSELVAIKDGDRSVGSAVRRRRDDGAGRDQERRRVQRAGRRHRRRDDEARRRRARRRGAVGGFGGRRADRVRRQR